MDVYLKSLVDEHTYTYVLNNNNTLLNVTSLNLWDGNFTAANISFWVGCMITDNNTCRWRNGIGHLFTDYNAQYISVGNERCIELSAQHGYNWDAARCKVENAYVCQQGKWGKMFSSMDNLEA